MGNFFDAIEKKIYNGIKPKLFELNTNDVKLLFSAPTFEARRLSEEKIESIKDDDASLYNHILYLMLYSINSIDGKSIKDIIADDDAKSLEEVVNNLENTIINNIHPDKLGQIIFEYNEFLKHNMVSIDKILLENSVDINELLNKKEEAK